MKFLRRFQRTKVAILFFTILLIGFGTPNVFAKEDLQPILSKIRENSRRSISSFKGIDYKRNLTITEIDPSTGKEISVLNIV